MADFLKGGNFFYRTKIPTAWELYHIDSANGLSYHEKLAKVQAFLGQLENGKNSAREWDKEQNSLRFL